MFLARIAFVFAVALALGAALVARYPLENVTDPRADSPDSVYLTVAAIELCLAGSALWGALAIASRARAWRRYRLALLVLLLLTPFPYADEAYVNFALAATVAAGAAAYAAFAARLRRRTSPAPRSPGGAGRRRRCGP